MPERPTGISVLAILAGLFGIILVIGGVAVGLVASAISDFIKSYAEEYGATIGVGIVDFSGLIEAGLIAFAAIALIFGILYIVVAYGFWIGAGWSRLLAIILSVLGIIFGLITLPSGIILIIIYGLILWYLMRSDVKAFFGAGPPPSPPPAPPV